MDDERQSEAERKFDLPAESLLLLPLPFPAPIEVEPHLSDGIETAGHPSRKVLLHERHFPAPIGIVVHRSGMQAHHGQADIRVCVAQSEEGRMRRSVNRGTHHSANPGFARSRDRLRPVDIECLVERMRMRIYQFHIVRVSYPPSPVRRTDRLPDSSVRPCRIPAAPVSSFRIFSPATPGPSRRVPAPAARPKSVLSVCRCAAPAYPCPQPPRHADTP